MSTESRIYSYWGHGKLTAASTLVEETVSNFLVSTVYKDLSLGENIVRNCLEVQGIVWRIVRVCPYTGQFGFIN